MILGILLTLRPEACFEVNQNAARGPDHAVAKHEAELGQRRNLLFGKMAAGTPLNDEIAAPSGFQGTAMGDGARLPQ
jgi:hypothetical protein